MARLAPPTPAAIVAPRDALSFGSGAGAYDGSELHARDFAAIHRFVEEVRRSNEALAGVILAHSTEDEGSYNSVPPLKSLYVRAVFERGAEIPPVPFDLDDEDSGS